MDSPPPHSRVKGIFSFSKIKSSVPGTQLAKGSFCRVLGRQICLCPNHSKFQRYKMSGSTRPGDEGKRGFLVFKNRTLKTAIFETRSLGSMIFNLGPGQMFHQVLYSLAPIKGVWDLSGGFPRGWEAAAGWKDRLGDNFKKVGGDLWNLGSLLTTNWSHLT